MNVRFAKRLPGLILAMLLAVSLIGSAAAATAASDLDSTFDTDGKVFTKFPIGGFVYTDFGGQGGHALCFAAQSDGKYLVGGYAYNGSDTDFAIARFNPDGSLDTSFGGDGVVTTDILLQDAMFDMLIQADGKIVAVGESESDDWDYDHTIVRYNPDGSLDTTFDGDGIAIYDVTGGSDYGRAIALVEPPPGKVSVDKYLVVGSIGPGADMAYSILRLNSDGSLDTSFDGDGILFSDIAVGWAFPSDIAARSDGSFYIAGTADHHGGAGPSEMTLARYLSSGALDTTFDTDGIAVATYTNGSEANAMLVQPDGKVLVAGKASSGSSDDFALARFNTNGSLDATFGSGGKQTTDFGGNLDEKILALHLQTDGTIMAAGSIYLDWRESPALARYTASGVLDTTFSGDGWAVAREAGMARGVDVLANGKILIGGSYGGFFVGLFNADGTVDRTFGSQTDLGRGMAGFYTLLQQPDGKLVAFGDVYDSNVNYSYDMIMARYNSDGSLDPGFGSGGKVNLDLGTGLGDWIEDTALLPDGKILALIGMEDQDNEYAYLARFNSSGSLDTSFGTGGLAPLQCAELCSGRALLLLPDGKIVVAGRAWNSGENNTFFVLRLNADGTFDDGFDSDGMVFIDFGNQSYANSLALLPGGDLLVSGNIWMPDGSEFYDYIALARLNSDGSLDGAFGTGGKASAAFDLGSITSGMAIQNDGKIVVAGTAAMYRGDSKSANYDDILAVRFNVDGSVDTAFGTNGIIHIDISGNDWGTDVLIQMGGKILVTGVTGSATQGENALIARLNTDGSLDTTFNTTGILNLDFGGHDRAYTILEQFDGKLVMTGSSQLDNYNMNAILARLQGDPIYRTYMPAISR